MGRRSIVIVVIVYVRVLKGSVCIFSAAIKAAQYGRKRGCTANIDSAFMDEVTIVDAMRSIEWYML